MKNYVIWNLPPGKSNGIRALYLLADTLKARGETVRLISWGKRVPGYDYICEPTKQMRQNDIIIYPEIVIGNPLRFQNVVRWVLYYPGQNGGSTVYHPSEKIFAWEERFFPNVPLLYLSGIDRKLFHDPGLPKMQNCYFVHKGGKFRDVPEITGAVEINMNFPKTRPELSKLLQTTDTLYSYDPDSVLMEEALLCGAKVKVITKDSIEDYHSREHFSEQTLQSQINDFIQITQAMNYTGKLEKVPLRRFLKKMFYRFLYKVTQKEKFYKRIIRL